MLGVGATQTLSRFGSSSHINIKSSEAVDVPCSDGSLAPAGASPGSGKKRSSLLKGLKRLSTLFSGSSSVSAGAVEVRPDSDPSLRDGLAHALSTPDLPYAAPISMSASPSPSYMDMAQNHRLVSALRSGGNGRASPPIELHSPCSPFPGAGRGPSRREAVPQFSSISSCESTSLRCVVSCGTPQVLMSSAPLIDHLKHVKLDQRQEHQHQVAQQQQLLPSSSPVAILSPYHSVSSGSGKLEKVAMAESASPTAPLSGDAPAVAPPLQPAAFLAPPPPAPPQPATTLLALNPAVPGPMRRRIWCLEDYQVVKRLYKGSSASVYKATCLRSGMAVALKVYFLTRVPRNVVHMIKREIELHHPLVHPNIVQLHAAFLDGDRIVLVQEYAARGDLFHLLRQMGGRMTEEQVSELVMRPFLDALAYLHSKGICHRDIKPENILYNELWVLKIADFGVSINMNDERAVTRAGTIDYMAPEVSRCPLKAEPNDNKDNAALAYTSAVDVWAAGVLSYELLVGFTPMVGSPHGAAASGRLSQQRSDGVGRFLATAASSRTLHFPASLSQASRDFILASLSESPGDRPTALELLRHPWLSA
ncbi:hypothetical protein PLESTB_001001800 [Pleodorina starrii]|uniref:Protein kinase domain-containing protein n=1 Tax=Pleodorina starrii TaxID=330485 RepID=A0A9W6F3Y8_9CHLO|nr:hypothetical protein PLESTM_001205600 [Pleodorina starrii]GLC55572.1 hypothetical protein PLESTB_001001800 [Pleodorina starrii]GLC65322.1 hypothetical protein PLESTF_000280300 [Pleodorina starrii]